MPAESRPTLPRAKYGNHLLWFLILPWVTVIICWVLMGAMITTGRYWTWEKIALLLC